MTATGGTVGVARAEYDPAARTLYLALERLGPAGALGPPEVTLECARIPRVAAVETPGQPPPAWELDPGQMRLSVRLPVAGRR